MGNECEMGFGLWRVAIAWVASVPLDNGVVEGRKDRSVGAEGSLGRDDAEGLRVQCWP